MLRYNFNMTASYLLCILPWSMTIANIFKRKQQPIKTKEKHILLKLHFRLRFNNECHLGLFKSIAEKNQNPFINKILFSPRNVILEQLFLHSNSQYSFIAQKHQTAPFNVKTDLNYNFIVRATMELTVVI